MSSRLEEPKTHNGPTYAAPATADPYAADGYYVEEEGAGWLFFAATMLGLAGLFSTVDGIVALSKSTFYVADARYVFSDLHTWGWIVLLVGIIEICASFAILVRSQWARWFGIAVASLGALAQFAFMQSYPFWSLTALTLCILTVYGLAAHGGRPQSSKT
jgi:hypothetical protein